MNKRSFLETKTILIFGCLIIALLCCVPFIKDGIKVGADTTFHMNRIESIKEAIENGVYWPYVYTEQNYCFGYGTPLFYGQLFLYPAVLLRLLGLGIALTWKIYLFIIVFFIALSVTYSTKKVLNTTNYCLPLISGFLCTFNTFFVSRALQRAALGEMLALIFIPLVLVETYEIIKNDKCNWFNLGLAFFCLLLSHNISFVLTVLVFAITILINIRNIVKLKLYINILKATLFAILLSSFFLFPMLEQLSGGIYNINNSVANAITLYGVEFIEYLDFYTIPFGVKLAINLSLLVLPIIYLFTKNKSHTYISITGIILLIVSSEIFPWQTLGFLSFIQFPSRLITIALPYLSIASVLSLNYIYLNKKKFLMFISIVVLLESVVGTTISLINIYLDGGLIKKTTTPENIKTGNTLYLDKDINFSYNIPETSGNEYLPFGFAGDFYSKSLIPQIESPNHKVDLLYKKYNEQNYKFTVKDDTTFVFPKTYYKGYVVNIYENGKYIETLQTKPDKTNNAFVSVTLDNCYKGREIQLQLVYKNTKIQKISITITLTTFISTIGYLIYKKKKSI